MRGLVTRSARALSTAAFLAGALVLAVVMFAPAQAFAHPGHSHAAGLNVSQVSPIPADLGVALAPRQSEKQAQGSPSRSSKLSAFVDVSSNPQPPGSKACTGGCCTSSGTSCCEASLVTSAPTIAPPLGRWSFSELAHEGTGITPGALSKPPKSLV
jgi:hypothetical protein